MSLRAQAPIQAAPITLNNINKTRYKSVGRQARYKNQSFEFRRKFTPRVHKSFTCYQDVPNYFRKNRSFSVEKSRKYVPEPRRNNASFRGKGMAYTGKFPVSCGATGEFDNGKENKHKREVMQAWLERGSSEMKLGRFDAALECFKKVTREEPNNPDSLYNKALCFMKKGQHKKAIPDLLSLTRDHPIINREVYVSLAMCFVATGDYTTAVRQISRGLLKFPKYVEGYITRGQLYNSQQKWDKAIQDFYKALSFNGSEGGAYMGLAESLVGMGDIRNAVKILEQAISCEKTCVQALMRRAHLLFDEKEYLKALRDLDCLLEVDDKHAEAYYYKALILLCQENLNDAMLCLEQVIKHDSFEKKFTGPALYNLGAIKIKQKDFYGAIYTFKRATDLEVGLKEQQVLKGYVEAILSLIKRKFKDAITLLTRIIKKKHPLLKEYIGNCYCYRGYAYAAIDNHEKAVKDLQHVTKTQELENASTYNYLISQGVLLSHKDPQSALECFSKASELFPKNVEPFCYQAKVQVLLASEKNELKFAEKAKSNLDKAIEMRDSESELYFLRGLCLYYLERDSDAIEDFETAIDKAEDNMAYHFLCRGFCYARVKMFKEAIQDFTIVLQLDENYSDAYYYRGRCALLLDDTSLAFSDFKKLILAKPEEATVHIYAGNLLMATGSIEDACKAYKNANSYKKTVEAHIQQAKCYFLTNSVNEALEELKNAYEIETTPELLFDIEVLSILLSSHNKEDLKKALVKSNSKLTKMLKSETEGLIFKMKHVHWYKGVFFFYLGQFQKAQAELKQAMDKKERLNLLKSSKADRRFEEDNAEVLYNLALCYLMTDYYEAASMHLYEIMGLVKGKVKGKVLLLLGLLHISLEQSEEAKELITEAYKYDNKLVSKYIEKKDEVKILPFHSDSSLVSEFPLIKVEVGNAHSVMIKPAFGLPKVLPPSMDFGKEKEILLHFKVKCKPEAPWLNRVKGAIQFTEEIQDIISEPITETENSEKNSETEESEVFSSAFDKRQYHSAVALQRGDSERPRNTEPTTELFEEAMKKKESYQEEYLEEPDMSEDEIARRIDAMCTPFEDDDDD